MTDLLFGAIDVIEWQYLRPPNERAATMKNVFVWAHRGASGVAPENTLAAFHAAEQAGANGVELDVRLSSDGCPVVMHDRTLDRTTNGRGPLAGFTLAELRRFDAGGWFAPQFAGEPVPGLEQVLKWASGRLRLNLEVKEFEAGLAVTALVKRYPACRVLLSSFDHGLLAALRKEAPWLPLGFLSEHRSWYREIEEAVACGAESFHPRQDFLAAEHVAQCHARGLKVYPWVVDDDERFRALLRMGVDGLFTNYPGRFCQR